MVRRDLTNREIEQMHREEPGSAARYLAERRKEIAAAAEKKQEEEEKERFIVEFMAAGGTSRVDGEKAFKIHKNEQAAEAARAVDQAASNRTRRHVTSRL